MTASTINAQPLVIESPAATTLADYTTAREFLVYINVGVTMLHERRAGRKLRKGSAQRHTVAQNVADACRIAVDQRLSLFNDSQRGEILQAWAFVSRCLADNLAAQVADRNR